MSVRDRLIRAGLWGATNPADPAQKIEAAFQVVEKMRERGWTPSICSLHPKPAWNSWVVAFHDHTEKQNRASARADTAPLAIVLAALAALEQGQAPEESGDMGRS